ncbi:transporter substrate-binding domain-containing protein [Halarcobacter ebronensis]|nr:transporter substrate-binding domain-containing protein [Halarcobacter ebronensis]QKF82948.1 BvgS-like domain-containing signal transduction sensor histidine kinase (PAS domain) [Halarcobacter ebronensis]
MKKFFYLIPFLFLINLYAEDNKLIGEINSYLTKEEIAYINDKKVIKVSNEFDYEPMDFSVDGIALGYSIDLLNILAKKIGIEVEYVTKPWTELLDDLYAGKIDLIHTIYKSNKREETLYFSTPYLISENYYITRKDNRKNVKLASLKNEKFGVSKGWHEENIVNQYPNVKKIYYENLKSKLEALSMGKIDIFMNDRNIANYYIKKYGYTNIKVANQVNESENEELDKYYFATLKEQSILISILNKAYMNVSIDLLNKLQDRWFGKIRNQVFNLSEQEYLDKKAKIRMCVFPKSMPVSDVNKENVEGIISDILKELYENVQLEFELIQTDSFKTTFDYLKEGKCEVLPTVEYSKKNRDKYNLTSPYLNLPYVAIGKSDKAFFSDLLELKDKTISVVSYTSLIKALKEQYPSIKIRTVNSVEEGLDLVKSGEVYAHLTLYPIARYYKAKSSYSSLKIIGRLIEPLKLSIAVIKSEPILLGIIQKSIDTIPKSKIDNIVNNWTEVKIQKVQDYSLLLKILIVIFVLILLGVWRYKILKETNEEITSINDELHKSQSELIKQKEEFEAIFRYSKDGIAILDFELRFIDFNSSYLKMLGYSPEEIKRKKFIEILSLEEKENIEMIFKEVLENGYIDNFEKVCLGKDGKRVSTNITITLMPDKSRLLLTAKDMTSTKLLESQSKLASMGEMIGNIAHQWRQPLSVITTSASGLSLKAEMLDSIKSDEVIMFSNQIIEQAQYLSKTIDDFRNFIREDLNYSEISVKEALLNAIAIARVAIKSNYITVVEDIQDDLTIIGNKNELGQAFINIINNAKDKLKEISEKEQKRYIFISTKSVDKNTLEVKILDNGRGIEEKIINRIFEPYFTTKHQSIGTGLGLSMSDKIIRERHKGLIHVYNEEFEYHKKKYKGAAFIISLSKNNILQ